MSHVVTGNGGATQKIKERKSYFDENLSCLDRTGDVPMASRELTPVDCA